MSPGTNLGSGGAHVTVHDLSSTGMLIETKAKLGPFDGFEVELPEIGVVQSLVIWSSGRYFGCEFGERLSTAAISAALLSSDPASKIDSAPAAVSAAAVEAPRLGRATDDYEEKAPLGVHLRVILGSPVFLWLLIIWAISSLVGFIRTSLG